MPTLDARGRVVPGLFCNFADASSLDGWQTALAVFQSWRPTWDLAEVEAELTLAERAVGRHEDFGPHQRRLQRAHQRFVSAVGQGEVSRCHGEVRAAAWNHFKGAVGSKIGGILSLSWLPGRRHGRRPASPGAGGGEEEEEQDATAPTAPPLCCICWSKRAVVAAVPCGHLLCCDACAHQSKLGRGTQCFSCRARVSSTLKVWF